MGNEQKIVQYRITFAFISGDAESDRAREILCTAIRGIRELGDEPMIEVFENGVRVRVIVAGVQFDGSDFDGPWSTEGASD